LIKVISLIRAYAEGGEYSTKELASQLIADYFEHLQYGIQHNLKKSVGSLPVQLKRAIRGLMLCEPNIFIFCVLLTALFSSSFHLTYQVHFFMR
jgi:hypothetical protein